MSMHTIYVKKSGKSLNIDFATLPPHVQEHIIEYGLKQKVNDCHASEENPETAWALVKALAERLRQGDITKRAGGRSPTEIELDNLIAAVIKQKLGKGAKEIKDLDREARIGLLAEYLGKPADAILAHFTKKAEEIVKARQVELGDLELE